MLVSISSWFDSVWGFLPTLSLYIGRVCVCNVSCDSVLLLSWMW